MSTTFPWQTLGVPAGLVRNRDGTRNEYSVRWDMDTSAPGMCGWRSVTRRFATADEAKAAVAVGMGHAFCATAFDETSQIAVRRNPMHRRNRRSARKVAA